MWNQSSMGGVVIPASTRIVRRPGQPSVNAVTSVSSVRPTARRHWRISVEMSVSSLRDRSEHLPASARSFDIADADLQVFVALFAAADERQVHADSDRCCCCSCWLVRAFQCQTARRSAAEFEEQHARQTVKTAQIFTRRGALQMGVTVPSDLTHEAAGLLKALAWPISVLLSLTMLRHPISDFLRDISKRVTKLSIFKVEIGLAKLNALGRSRGHAQPSAKGLFQARRATVDANANILNMETMPIVTTGIIRASMADYVIIDVGDGDDMAHIFGSTSWLHFWSGVWSVRSCSPPKVTSLVTHITFGRCSELPLRNMSVRACGDAGDLHMSEFWHSGWGEPVISMNHLRGFVGHGDIAVATPPAVMTRWTGWPFVTLRSSATSSAMSSALKLGEIPALAGADGGFVTPLRPRRALGIV